MSSFSGCSRGKEVNLLPPVSPAGSSHVSCTPRVLDGMGSSSEGQTAWPGTRLPRAETFGLLGAKTRAKV
jgi:hypothetical protein